MIATFTNLNQQKKKDENNSKYIFSKVVLKNNSENYIIILDKFNRIIKCNFINKQKINLYDLIIIINCSIKKSLEDEFIYELKLNKNSLFHISKELILNKEISINNYTI